MIAMALCVALLQDAPVRTPAIYRCPAIEAESKFFAPFVKESGFDSFCIEPKPGPKAAQIAKGQVKFVSGALIDTKANLAWRNAIVAFANGKISPKEWLDRVKSLKETVHFLSSPKTPSYREATGQDVGHAMTGEMLLLAWPGKPCLTADDIVQTRYFPEDKHHESWVLAMNDWLGPMLYMRHDFPTIVTGKPEIVRADSVPGLFAFRYAKSKRAYTFWLNNSQKSIELPKSVDLDKTSICVGLDWENDQTPPKLGKNGYLIVVEGDDS